MKKVIRQCWAINPWCLNFEGRLTNGSLIQAILPLFPLSCIRYPGPVVTRVPHLCELRPIADDDLLDLSLFIWGIHDGIGFKWALKDYSKQLRLLMCTTCNWMTPSTSDGGGSSSLLWRLSQFDPQLPIYSPTLDANRDSSSVDSLANATG